MGNGRMVLGLRGDHLDQFSKKLSGIVRANEWVRTEGSRRQKESGPPPPFHRAAH